jgi:hypothetical protein
MVIKKTNTAPYHPKTNDEAEVCNKTIAAYLKTLVQHWNGNYTLLQFPTEVSKPPYKVLFGHESRFAQNPNRDLRKHCGEDMGTEMFQRLQV